MAQERRRELLNGGEENEKTLEVLCVYQIAIVYRSLRTCLTPSITRKGDAVTTLTSKMSFRCPGLRLKYR